MVNRTDGGIYRFWGVKSGSMIKKRRVYWNGWAGSFFWTEGGLHTFSLMCPGLWPLLQLTGSPFKLPFLPWASEKITQLRGLSGGFFWEQPRKRTELGSKKNGRIVLCRVSEERVVVLLIFPHEQLFMVVILKFLKFVPYLKVVAARYKSKVGGERRSNRGVIPTVTIALPLFNP